MVYLININLVLILFWRDNVCIQTETRPEYIKNIITDPLLMKIADEIADFIVSRCVYEVADES